MLSGQSTSRPRLAAHRRNRGHDRLSPEDGHARGAEAVSPTQPGDRVLPRLDQKQTGIAPVSPAWPGQGANGNALGLPDLQPATVDPIAPTATRKRRLGPQRRDRNRVTPYAKSNYASSFRNPFIKPSIFFRGCRRWFFHTFAFRKVGLPAAQKLQKLRLVIFANRVTMGPQFTSMERAAA